MEQEEDRLEHALVVTVIRVLLKMKVIGNHANAWAVMQQMEHALPERLAVGWLLIAVVATRLTMHAMVIG
jgi:hypothetical protein